MCDHTQLQKGQHHIVLRGKFIQNAKNVQIATQNERCSSFLYTEPSSEEIVVERALKTAMPV